MSAPTPLTLPRYVANLINLRGPISVAHYMRLALTHPTLGYYAARPSSAIFGPCGDFVTAPDISHLVGELSCAWLLSTWWPGTLSASRTRKSSPLPPLQIVEMGPGNATLLCDVVKTLVNFREPREALARLSMVELSPSLREAQLAALLATQEFGDTRTITRNELNWLSEVTTESGAEFIWHDHISDVKNDMYTMLLAHEYFDALPIYKFTRTRDDGWREILVDVNDDDGNRGEKFKFVVARNETPALAILCAMRDKSWIDAAPIGTRVELSPDAAAQAASVASLVDAGKGGGALVVDYGYTRDTGSPACGAKGWSLRAISNHLHVPLFTDCGSADISADVDFSALVSAVRRAAPRAMIHGPCMQREFLESLGIHARLDKLRSELRSSRATNGDTDARIHALNGASARLLSDDEDGMGRVYKCLGISSAAAGDAQI